MIKILLIVGLFSSCSLIKKIHSKKKKEVLVSSWNKYLGTKYDSGNLPVSLSGINAKEGIVYAGAANGKLIAFNIDNGREIWENGSGTGFHTSPSFFNDQVIIGNISGRLYSFNRFTGKLKYSIDLNSAIESEPTIYKNRIFLHLRNHKLVVLDGNTGKIVWSYQRAVPFKTTLQGTSKTKIVGNNIYIGFADGFVVNLFLEDGKVLWEKKLSTGSKFVDVDITPFIEGKKLYIGSLSGSFSILDRFSGTLLRRFDFSASRSPVKINNRKFIGTVKGKVVKLDEYDNIIKEYKISDFAISNINEWKEGLVVSTTGGKLFYISKDEKIEEVFDFGSVASGVFSKVIKEDNKLLIFSSRNRLYVFK